MTAVEVVLTGKLNHAGQGSVVVAVQRLDFAAAQQHPYVGMWSSAAEGVKMCVGSLCHTGLLPMALGLLKHMA